MYIAFRWLLGLTLAMWIAMCSLDTFALKNHTVMNGLGFKSFPFAFENTTNVEKFPVTANFNLRSEKYLRLEDKQHDKSFLHCIMFIAGAFVVTIYNRFDKIVLILKREFSNISSSDKLKLLRESAKKSILESIKNIIVFYKNIKQKMRNVANLSRHPFLLYFKTLRKPKINLILLKKLKEVGEERKNLAELLLAALHENKNIRLQYQLESMAKNRLARHIENTQKVIKENRSRYVSFQQLYLVTHQENTFLKCRLKKLTKEKDEAEKHMLELMNEIYKSKNNELKAYCTRFIVNTKENLLHSDAGTEINKFLHRDKDATVSNWRIPKQDGIGVNTTNSWLKCSSHIENIKVIGDDGSIIPLVSEAPKLRGLPGEYFWTVKDKDGLVEKLYEYDCESESNGDTVRRIREYSVYYDKDCLLDCSGSSIGIHEGVSRSLYSSDGPLTNHKFLTGSQAFRNFMNNNMNLVATTVMPAPLQLLSN